MIYSSYNFGLFKTASFDASFFFTEFSIGWISVKKIDAHQEKYFLIDARLLY